MRGRLDSLQLLTRVTAGVCPWSHGQGPGRDEQTSPSCWPQNTTVFGDRHGRWMTKRECRYRELECWGCQTGSVTDRQTEMMTCARGPFRPLCIFVQVAKWTLSPRCRWVGSPERRASVDRPQTSARQKRAGRERQCLRTDGILVCRDDRKILLQHSPSTTVPPSLMRGFHVVAKNSSLTRLSRISGAKCHLLKTCH